MACLYIVNKSDAVPAIKLFCAACSKCVLKYASLLFTGDVHLSHHKLKKRNDKDMMLLFLNGGGEKGDTGFYW